MCGFRRPVARRTSRLDLDKWPNRMSPSGLGRVFQSLCISHVVRLDVLAMLQAVYGQLRRVTDKFRGNALRGALRKHL